MDASDDIWLNEGKSVDDDDDDAILGEMKRRKSFRVNVTHHYNVNIS